MRAHELTDRSRLRIPLLVGEDCIHGHSFWEGATIFPTQLGMAGSWDAGLIERAARVTAVEVAATGIHWTFSPVLCITRDLRWAGSTRPSARTPSSSASSPRRWCADTRRGAPRRARHPRHRETLRGLLRDAGRQRCLRGRPVAPQAALLVPAPFERVAREGCGTFMLGYQTTDGVPITLNEWLLTDVLRGDWGYGGMLITDWDNVGRMVWEQQIQPDYAHAAAAAVKAGNDMIMTTPRFFEGALQAIAAGMLDEADLDAAVARILTVKFELGLFENPRRPDPQRIATEIATPSTRR
nr:glycoside hydrolase family 3 N-terminal domain-containing protein [Tessaracoccus coleopterorum]